MNSIIPLHWRGVGVGHKKDIHFTARNISLIKMKYCFMRLRGLRSPLSLLTQASQALPAAGYRSHPCRILILNSYILHLISYIGTILI